MFKNAAVQNWPFVVFYGYLSGMILAYNVLIEFSYLSVLISIISVFIFFIDDDCGVK